MISLQNEINPQDTNEEIMGIHGNDKTVVRRTVEKEAKGVSSLERKMISLENEINLLRETNEEVIISYGEDETVL